MIVAIGAAVLVLDQLTKLWALRALRPGAPVHVIDGFLALTLVMNPGLAFGMLAGVPEGWRWLVGILSLGALALLAVIAVRFLPEAGRWGRLAVALVFGGAIGNLIDRVRFGAVVDFVDVYVGAYHWPAFNVADSAISVGVALLALRMLRPEPARV